MFGKVDWGTMGKQSMSVAVSFSSNCSVPVICCFLWVNPFAHCLCYFLDHRLVFDLQGSRIYYIRSPVGRIGSVITGNLFLFSFSDIFQTQGEFFLPKRCLGLVDWRTTVAVGPLFKRPTFLFYCIKLLFPVCQLSWESATFTGTQNKFLGLYSTN